jgi:2-phosphoglycerate kinase
MAERTVRTWDVLLVCGASGVGKSSLSHPLAARHGVTVLEVDDIVCAVQAVTTARTMPALHFWDAHPDPTSLTAAQVFERGLALLAEIGPAVAAVIGNHLETGTPVVIDGDFVAPSSAAAAEFAGQPSHGRVRAVVVSEDEEQVIANHLARQPDQGAPALRAAVSALWTDWFIADAAAVGVPVIAARPWPTLLARVERALLPPVDPVEFRRDVDSLLDTAT